VTSLNQARADLHSFVANCTTSGSCSQQAINDANKAIVQDSLYSLAIQSLYGTDQNAGAFAPFGQAQTTIVNNLATLQTTIAALLGTPVDFGTPLGANGQAALLQLQQLATAPNGVALDSIGSPDRLGIGDVEVSALFKLVDGFSDTTGGMKLRGTLRGVLRLGTGRPPTGTVPYEVGTWTGQYSADGGGILDVRFSRRLMATFAGLYTAYFTSSDVARLPNSDYALFPLDVPVVGSWREGDAIQLEATPRFQLTDYFTFHGAYAFRHQAASHYASPEISSAPLFAATTEQRAGLGFAFSTVTRYASGKTSVPFEIFFTHRVTLAGTGGLTPKLHRDQVEFRIYYRLRRPGR
jgi:hypothetical protein